MPSESSGAVPLVTLGQPPSDIVQPVIMDAASTNTAVAAGNSTRLNEVSAFEANKESKLAQLADDRERRIEEEEQRTFEKYVSTDRRVKYYSYKLRKPQFSLVAYQ